MAPKVGQLPDLVIGPCPNSTSTSESSCLLRGLLGQGCLEGSLSSTAAKHMMGTHSSSML